MLLDVKDLSGWVVLMVASGGVEGERHVCMSGKQSWQPVLRLRDLWTGKISPPSQICGQISLFFDSVSEITFWGLHKRNVNIKE